ncbi:hypothetical protein [Clostridium sp. MCC353]|uniref:hypothetical protein n=1 Tax=Clostridium sp. MCC353 TaxID=2592646 RepID=UPI002079B65F|nr:hypothetical protein [Clostridium sp. MCC353]
MNASGYMDTGWFQDRDGRWYYLNPVSDGTKGAMKTGWFQDQDGRWYYLNPVSDGTKGAMLTGWITVDGKQYYMDGSGAWNPSKGVRTLDDDSSDGDDTYSGGVNRPDENPPEEDPVNDLTIMEESSLTGGTYKNVVIAPEVGNGTVVLEDVVIKGDLHIKGGGLNSVKLKGRTIVEGRIIIDKEPGENREIPRLEVAGGVTIHKEIQVKQPAAIQTAPGDSYSFADVRAQADVTVAGDNTVVNSLSLTSDSGTAVNVTIKNSGAVIENIIVNCDAGLHGPAGGQKAGIGAVSTNTPARIELNHVAVERLTANADVEIEGTGSRIDLVEHGKNTIVENTDASVDIGEIQITDAYNWYYEGKESREYVLSSPEELYEFADIINGENNMEADSFSGAVVSLGADMDLSGKVWVPAGRRITVKNFTYEDGTYSEWRREYRAFQGTFDGQGHVISNMTIEPVSDDDVAILGAGLFAHVADATICNLVIKDCDVTGADRTAAVAAYVYGGDTVFDNITVEGGKVEALDGWACGAIIGQVWNYSDYNVGRPDSTVTISNCKNSAAITGQYNVGAMWGSITEAFNTNTFDQVKPDGTEYTATGYDTEMIISGCRNEGDITALQGTLGRLGGWAYCKTITLDAQDTFTDSESVIYTLKDKDVTDTCLLIGGLASNADKNFENTARVSSLESLAVVNINTPYSSAVAVAAKGEDVTVEKDRRGRCLVTIGEKQSIYTGDAEKLVIVAGGLDDEDIQLSGEQTITIKDGAAVKWIFAGGAGPVSAKGTGSADLEGDVRIVIEEGAKAGNVYGGGSGRSVRRGTSYIQVDGWVYNINGGGMGINESKLDGSSHHTDNHTDRAEITINGTANSAHGGGFSISSIDETSITVNGEITTMLVAGGANGYTGSANVEIGENAVLPGERAYPGNPEYAGCMTFQGGFRGIVGNVDIFVRQGAMLDGDFYIGTNSIKGDGQDAVFLDGSSLSVEFEPGFELNGDVYLGAGSNGDSLDAVSSINITGDSSIRVSKYMYSQNYKGEKPTELCSDELLGKVEFSGGAGWAADGNGIKSAFSLIGKEAEIRQILDDIMALEYKDETTDEWYFEFISDVEKYMEEYMEESMDESIRDENTDSLPADDLKNLIEEAKEYYEGLPTYEEYLLDKENEILQPVQNPETDKVIDGKEDEIIQDGTADGIVDGEHAGAGDEADGGIGQDETEDASTDEIIDGAEDVPTDEIKDGAEDASKDEIKDGTEDASKDEIKDGVEDASKDEIKDGAEDASKDETEDSSKDQIKDTSEDAPKDTADTGTAPGLKDETNDGNHSGHPDELQGGESASEKTDIENDEEIPDSGIVIENEENSSGQTDSMTETIITVNDDKNEQDEPSGAEEKGEQSSGARPEQTRQPDAVVKTDNEEAAEA